MCADTACLVLHLEGPLQSWGTTSQYNRRSTDLLPSRSAIMGMICAALGLARGSEDEKKWLDRCADLGMLAVAVPRMRRDRELAVRRLEDFHTVLHTLKASGGTKDCHITRRQYLLDAAFRVFLYGERSVLELAAQALQDPKWGLWLGRKCCIPAAPVFAGLFDTEENALHHCLPCHVDELIWVKDVPTFEDGADSVPDMPLSFATAARRFSLRRIQRSKGKRHAT